MKIAALIVSFNRLGMLQRCVASLRAQTRKLDGIIVMDSSTRSEVINWLDAQSDITTKSIENVGSAGSMHYGLQVGCELGYDWLWLMDDDVHVTPDALQELLNGLQKRPQLQFINSLCVRDNDASRPSMGAVSWRNNANNYLFGQVVLTVDEVRKHADADGFFDSIGGQLYHGSLISCALVEQVGVPIKEYFTRGEEVEYGLRMMRAGQHLYLYVPSIVMHPSNHTEFITVLGKRFPIGRIGTKKRYFTIRNSIHIRREYYKGYPYLPYVARRMAMGLFLEMFVDPDKTFGERIAGCVAIVRAVRDGLKMAWV